MISWEKSKLASTSKLRLTIPLTECIYSDTLLKMNTFLRTHEFDEWLKELRDHVAKARIIARIRSAEAGNFGDCEPVGDGISEMRIHVGAGYRAYYCRRGKIVYLLLCGGDKSSQRRDIRDAKRILKELEKHEGSDQII